MSERIDVTTVGVAVEKCPSKEAAGVCRKGVFQCVYLSTIETRSYQKATVVACDAPIPVQESEARVISSTAYFPKEAK